MKEGPKFAPRDRGIRTIARQGRLAGLLGLLAGAAMLAYAAAYDVSNRQTIFIIGAVFLSVSLSLLFFSRLIEKRNPFPED